ncbi:hypothetical protein C1645_770689 [Glomus cerebriforme]|uniref:Uncharacterized protein n=1 Tax=Glomus cerebriforme TaxID=658196 RepID=A0A397SVV7_9GLOM|nr:hypothetical protein C1645_770689 [Glomus cerebriforme]
MDRGTKDVEDKLKSVYMCAECCSKSNLELFHKELNEHKKRKVETMTNHKKVKEDKEKDSIPQLNLLNIGNNSDVNNNPKDVIFMGTFDNASRGQQSKKPTVNLFQTMINNQPNFTINFGEKTSFVQQQWMQPASGQTAHAQTLPKPIIPLPNVQESQNDHVQSSVPLFTSIQEQASFMQENLMTVPATTDTQEGDKLFNEKRKMISPFRKT